MSSSYNILLTAMLLFFSSIAFADLNNEEVITKRLNLKSNKKRVWSALTKKNELEKWWNVGVKLEPYEGGQFYEPWGDGQLATGKVLELKKQSFIKFTWQEKYWKPTEKTLCKFKLTENGEMTTIEVRHSGWETFKELDNRKKLIMGFNKGWDSLLPKLRKYIDSNP